MTPGGATSEPTKQTPKVCSIRNWHVFRTGRHRGENYPPARIARVAANFLRLRGRLNPKLKLGHSGDQEVADRAKQSLGFAGLGDVVAVRVTPRGDLFLDVANVPASLGAAVNAGRFPAGSIEVLPRVRDPDDPGEEIEGPVLTGVALLGEEQPAVKGCPPPRAVFADGTPVPPDPEPAPWLAAMADALKTYAARPQTYEFAGRMYAAQTLCFSEVSPMRHCIDQRLMAAGCDPQAYAHLSDDEADEAAGMHEKLKQFADGAGAMPAAAGNPEMMSDPAAADPAAPAAGDPAMMSAPQWAKKLMSDVAGAVTRVGALEAAEQDKAKKAGDAQFAAFAERVKVHLDADPADAAGRKRVTGANRQYLTDLGLAALTTAKFGAVAGDREKAFAAWKQYVAAVPPTTVYSDTFESASAGAAREFTPTMLGMVRADGLLARMRPRLAAELRAEAAGK